MQRIGGLAERSNPSCWPPMITNSSDNITNRAQNTKHKSIKAQTQKYNDTMIKKQNITQKHKNQFSHPV